MSNDSQKKSQEIFIERCPHDEENPYAQISRSLIRDQSISPECRWLLIYLLSMDKGWKISAKQIWHHVNGFIGRDRVWKLIKEAVDAGYMKSILVRKGNLRQGVKYYLSESPKFKNSNNVSDALVFSAPESSALKVSAHKKELPKEGTYISPPLTPPTKEEEEEIDRRIRERPKDAPRIVDKKKYRRTVLQDIRNESKDKFIGLFLAHKRKILAESWDGKKFNGMQVIASREHVEFTHGSYSRLVRYDVSDEEWKENTGWE